MQLGKLSGFASIAVSLTLSAASVRAEERVTYALDQQGYGQNASNIDGVRASIDIRPTRRTDGVITPMVEFGFVNTLDRVVRVHVTYLVFCEESASLPYQAAEAYEIAPGEGWGLVSACDRNATAGASFRIDS